MSLTPLDEVDGLKPVEMVRCKAKRTVNLGEHAETSVHCQARVTKDQDNAWHTTHQQTTVERDVTITYSWPA